MLLRTAKSCAEVESALDQLHQHFITEVSCEYRRGVLYLRGHTHSFYQKQMAQEAVRGLDGVKVIVNEIEVLS